MKYNTYLPIFSGFDYNSMFSFDYSAIEYELQEERKQKGLFSEVDFNKLDIDYKSYEENIAEKLCCQIAIALSDFIEGINFQGLAKNSVDVSIDIKEKEIASFIYTNKEKFCEYLKKRYTSYDGFFSWYSNDFDVWESETKKFSDFNKNGHYLGSILNFIAGQEGIKEEGFADILENIYIFDYVKNYQEFLNQSDNSLYELLTSNKVEKGFAEYVENSFNNGLVNSLCLPEKILSLINQFEQGRV